MGVSLKSIFSGILVFLRVGECCPFCFYPVDFLDLFDLDFAGYVEAICIRCLHQFSHLDTTESMLSLLLLFLDSSVLRQGSTVSKQHIPFPPSFPARLHCFVCAPDRAVPLLNALYATLAVNVVKFSRPASHNTKMFD